MEEYRTKFNNFHGWFPEGFYRVGGMCDKRESSPELIRDIDEALKEMNFDIHTYQRLRGGTAYIFHEVLDLARKMAARENREFTLEEERRKEILCEEGALVNEKLDKMMEPVFEKLVGKGYSKKDLTI